MAKTHPPNFPPTASTGALFGTTGNPPPPPTRKFSSALYFLKSHLDSELFCFFSVSLLSCTMLVIKFIMGVLQVSSECYALWAVVDRPHFSFQQKKFSIFSDIQWLSCSSLISLVSVLRVHSNGSDVILDFDVHIVSFVHCYQRMMYSSEAS